MAPGSLNWGLSTMVPFRALSAIAMATVLATAASATPPIEAYGALPNIADVEISPDGNRIALLVGDAAVRQVQIRGLDLKPIDATPVNNLKVRSLQWAGPDHLLISTSKTADVIDLTGPRREWYLLADMDLGRHKIVPLMKGIPDAMNVIADEPTVLMIGGHPVVIAPGFYYPPETNKGVLALFRLDLAAHTARRVETGTELTQEYLVDADGGAVARADYQQGRGVWSLFLRKKDGDWTRNRNETAPIDRPELRALGADGTSVLVSSRASGDWQTHAVSLGDGTWSDPLPDVQGTGLVLDPATRRMIGTVKTDFDGVHYSFTDPADQKRWNGIVHAFPHEVVRLASWSQDRSRLIVEVEGATNGDAFFIIDLKTHHADWLGDRYKGIAAEDVAEQRLIHYKAADGLDIPAFVTLPRGRAAKALPLVVLPHGGPADHDEPGFDWWAQALASRGYAVLQPQFRGSTGLYIDHLEAGYGQWGRKMQTDLSDGVRYLAAQGMIDPARVAIVGGSYGGYAALAGVTLDPGVYRCAVSLAGVSDLRRMLAWEDEQGNGEAKGRLRYWQRFMGAKGQGDTSIDAWSPARLADRVKVPVLLIHGKDDTVVAFEQSTLMLKALKAAGADVEFVTLASEDHWLSRGPTRTQALQAMVAFLEKHNPPGPPPAPAPPAKAAQ